MVFLLLETEDNILGLLFKDVEVTMVNFPKYSRLAILQNHSVWVHLVEQIPLMILDLM